MQTAITSFNTTCITKSCLKKHSFLTHSHELFGHDTKNKHIKSQLLEFKLTAGLSRVNDC